MELQKLSASERITLAEKLWDSVLEDNAEIKLTDSQKNALDRRLAAYAKDHDSGSPWREIKDRIIGKRGS